MSIAAIPGTDFLSCASASTRFVWKRAIQLAIVPLVTRSRHRFLLCNFVAVAGFFPCLPSPAAESGEAEPEGTLPLDKMVERGDVTWKLTLKQVRKYFPDHGFEWLSAMKEAVRSTEGDLQLFGEPVGETIIRTEDGVVNRLDISIYNVGDDGGIKGDGFSRLRAQWQKRVQEWVEVEPEAPATAKNSVVGSNLRRTLWYTPHSAVLLESSTSRGQPKFLRLRLAPKPSGAAYLGNTAGTTNKTKTKSDLRQYVLRESNGDNVIRAVPMVDQGPKGYCAVAAAERLFRYYGLEIDQHEMALVANSSAAQGTDPRVMLGVLGKVASKLNLRARTHIEWDVKGFLGMVENYNREADRRKEFGKRVEGRRGGVIYLDQYYAKFDPELLKAVRAKGNDFSKFESEVRRYLDQGIPLLWSVFLGVFKEEDIPQARGGHMRLIIGFNDRTGELLYSDTWGEGHELKRMPMAQAYAITMGLHSIQPSR